MCLFSPEKAMTPARKEKRSAFRNFLKTLLKMYKLKPEGSGPAMRDFLHSVHAQD